MTEVRRVTEAEFEPWMRAEMAGFMEEYHEGSAEFQLPHTDLDRAWAAFDGDRVVGTLRTFASEMTVPGAVVVPAGALTNVTVAQTHRRRGLLTEMMTAELRRSRDAGDPVVILIASEYPIYGRFGFGPATESAHYALDLTSTAGRPRLRHGLDEPAGTVEFTDLTALRAVGPGIFEGHRRGRPGEIGRDDWWWDRNTEQVLRPGLKPFKGYVALHRGDDGQPDGYVRYTVKHEWDGMRPKATAQVEALVTAAGDAYRALWLFLADLDLVTTVEAGDRPADELFPWLVTDARVFRQTARYDFVWARPIDVPAYLSARTYLTSGTVVLEVHDGLGLCGGRYRLEGGPDGATCTPTDADPDLTLGAAMLGAISLGAFPLSALAAAGHVDEHSAGALATADAMFRSTVTPWCATWF